MNRVLALLCVLAACFTTFAARADLLARDLDGNPSTAEAYYDTTLDITWIADWHYQRTSGANFTGGATWAGAKTWAEGLNYFGVTGWRLPAIRPVNSISFQYNFTNNGSSDIGYASRGTGWGPASELGHLFYVTLNNDGYCLSSNTAPTGCVFSPRFLAGQFPNTGPFRNTQYTDGFWLDQAYSPTSGYAWLIQFTSLYQLGWASGELFGAVVVRDGDVSAIPEPSSGLLLSLGLVLGLIVLRSHRNSTT